MSNNERYSNRWFKQAQYDLNSSKDSIKSENYEWACFQAQQSGEKALKSYLFLNRKRNVFTRSIKKLLEKCGAFSSRFFILKRAKLLDLYYIPTRYPNGLPDDIPHEFYVKEDAEKCVKYARKIICLVGDLLKKD